MAKYKHYDYSQSVLIPVCLDEQLIPGTLEFAIHNLVEERIDTSIFEDRYHNDETGRLSTCLSGIISCRIRLKCVSCPSGRWE